MNEELIREIDAELHYWGDALGSVVDVLRRCRAALAAPSAQVPREPTEAMLFAAHKCSLGTGVVTHNRAIWYAMYDAAQPPSEKERG